MLWLPASTAATAAVPCRGEGEQVMAANNQGQHVDHTVSEALNHCVMAATCIAAVATGDKEISLPWHTHKVQCRIAARHNHHATKKPCRPTEDGIQPATCMHPRWHSRVPAGCSLTGPGCCVHTRVVCDSRHPGCLGMNRSTQIAHGGGCTSVSFTH